MKRILVLASWVCLVTVLPASAQYPRPAQAQPPAERTERQKAAMAKGLTPDSAFVIAAAQAAFAGEMLGKMALEKALSPEVKQFARRAADESAKMAVGLQPILKAQNTPEPKELDQRNKSVHEWLSRLSGAEFDRAYMSNAASMQSNELMVYERAAQRSMNEDVKSFASKTLPLLKEQQESAMTLTKKIAGQP